jgi:hypothetical protein
MRGGAGAEEAAYKKVVIPAITDISLPWNVLIMEVLDNE